jgi:hypothetical protein
MHFIDLLNSMFVLMLIQVIDQALAGILLKALLETHRTALPPCKRGGGRGGREGGWGGVFRRETRKVYAGVRDGDVVLLRNVLCKRVCL